MRPRAGGIGVCLIAALSAGFAACSLNPQPLPPYNYDAAGPPPVDAAGTANPDAGLGTDAGSMDDSAVPQGGDAEAGADAQTSADAEADASDATADAPADSSDDAAADATGD